MLARMRVEHELRERAMQPRHRAAHGDEAAAGDLRRGGEIEAAEALADVHVVLGREGELARPAVARRPAPLLAVLVRVADRHRLVREVRNTAEEVLQFRLQAAELLFGRLELRLGALGLLHEVRDVAALRLGHADFLGEAVAGGLRLLDARLQLLPLGLEALELLHVEGARTPRGEAARHVLGVLAQELDVDHSFFVALSSSRSCASFSRIFASRPRSVGRYHPGGRMPSGQYVSPAAYARVSSWA